MEVGLALVDGSRVGTIKISLVDRLGEDTFTPDTEGYVPQGRAEDNTRSFSAPSGHPSVGGHHRHHHEPHHYHGEERFGHHGESRHHEGGRPQGPDYTEGSRTYPQGSPEVERAIRRGAEEAGVDVDTFRAIASIESSLNPNSNAYNPRTQYKGLFQMGHEEWRRFGQGNIYSAEDNAMAAGRMFRENIRQFKEEHGGRNPTDAEMYMIHQQGLGFTTPGVKRGQNAAGITNEEHNLPPGSHVGHTRESFQAGWGHEIERRKADYAKRHPAPEAQLRQPPPADAPQYAAQVQLGKTTSGKSGFYSSEGVKQNPYPNFHQKPEDIENRRNEGDVPFKTGVELARDAAESELYYAPRRKEVYDNPMSKGLGVGDIAREEVKKLDEAATDSDFDRLENMSDEAQKASRAEAKLKSGE